MDEHEQHLESLRKRNLLKEALWPMGLDTLVRFQIDDPEFRGNVYHIDCFGDVYYLEDGYNEAYISEMLTLGRILTQYQDKILVCK